MWCFRAIDFVLVSLGFVERLVLQIAAPVSRLFHAGCIVRSVSYALRLRPVSRWGHSALRPCEGQWALRS